MSSVKVFWPKFNTESLVAALQEKVGRLGQDIPLKLVVLFGSYAKGNYTVASDIDLLVVYKGKARQDAYSLVCNAVDLPRLEPHVYSEGEYLKVEKTVQRMIKKGKVIYKEGTSKKP